MKFCNQDEFLNHLLVTEAEQDNPCSKCNADCCGPVPFTFDHLQSIFKKYGKTPEFKKRFNKTKTMMISSASSEWISELKDFLIDNYSTSVSENQEVKFINSQDIIVIDLKNDDDPRNVDLEYLWDYKFRASWKRLEQIVRMTDFTNLEAVMRVYDVLDKLWVIKKTVSTCCKHRWKWKICNRPSKTTDESRPFPCTNKRRWLWA